MREHTIGKKDDKLFENQVEFKAEFLSWLKFLLLLAIIFFTLRFALGITIINGNSMNPTFKNQDIVLTSNLFYKIERNDIVLVQDTNGFKIIKRVIALPGEKVEIENGIVYVNQQPIEENFTTGISSEMSEVKVEAGQYFIMGDNRTPGESLDSRSVDMGPIQEGQITGEAMISLLPFGLM